MKLPDAQIARSKWKAILVPGLVYAFWLAWLTHVAWVNIQAGNR
jgi:hypothetical protein